MTSWYQMEGVQSQEEDRRHRAEGQKDRRAEGQKTPSTKIKQYQTTSPSTLTGSNLADKHCK